MTEFKWRGFVLGESEWEKQGGQRGDWPMGRGVAEEKREEREMGGGQGPFKEERSECVQEVLLVSSAEDRPKSGQYRCLSTNVYRFHSASCMLTYWSIKQHCETG